MATNFGVRRAWRPLLLVLAGAFLGALVSGPVAGHFGVPRAAVAAAAALHTRSTSCPGYSFLPVKNATRYGYEGTLRQADSFVVCNPNLPTGAVVTKVQFTFKDLNSGGISLCGLFRVSLAVATAGQYQELAAVPGAPEFPEPGILRHADNTIQHATIDNANYAYWLQCRIDGFGPHLGIYGADVIYEISSANG